MMFIKVLFASLFISFAALKTAVASQEVVVRVNSAPVYDSPGGSKIGTLQQGRRYQSDGRAEDGYISLKTKSGRGMWIRQSDVTMKAENIEDDIVSEEQPVESEGSGMRLTYDIGFSTGSSGGVSYSEANLGLNLFIKEWLAWRNALFSRFVNPENIYGLDSSMRLFYSMNMGETSSLTVFGGPGYRFVTKGDSVPFAEAGLVTKLGSFQIGGGFKTFFNTTVRPGAPSDTQYFIILSGAGVIN